MGFFGRLAVVAGVAGAGVIATRAIGAWLDMHAHEIAVFVVALAM